jgi:hypothetical protein
MGFIARAMTKKIYASVIGPVLVYFFFRWEYSQSAAYMVYARQATRG